MKKLIYLTIILFITLPHFLFAQFIIEQTEVKLEAPYSLVDEDTEFEGPEDELAFFLAQGLERLKSTVEEEGLEITEEKSTMYVDGDNYAAESFSEEMGKVTFVGNSKTQSAHMILWEQKTVIEIKPEDMKAMQEKADQAVQEMLKNIPEDMREQVMAEMETENGSSTLSLTKTGMTKTINGYSCDEYSGTREEEEYISIFVCKDKLGLKAQIDDLTKNLSKMFNTGDEEEIDEWEYVPGTIPIQTSVLSYAMGGAPTLTINSITKIEQSKPSSKVFIVPGANDGFTKKDISEIYNY